MIASFRSICVILLSAVALTCASAAYQRVGARRMVEGEAWCGTPAPCAIRALGAGFPLPYLIDDPQVSVPNAVGLVEDDFRPDAFLTDVLFWLALAVLVFAVRQASHASTRRASPAIRGGPPSRLSARYRSK